MVTNPKNTVSGFRNLLGRGFSDPITQDEIRNVPFTVEERKDNTVGFRVSFIKIICLSPLNYACSLIGQSFRE